jgi:hypothetical protein
MATLIPEFARVMSESNRRAASALAEEVARVEGLRERVEVLHDPSVDWGTLRRRVARQARAAERGVVATAGELEEFWAGAVKSLRGLSTEEQILILQAATELAASGLQLRDSARHLWELVERLGGAPETSDDFASAGRTFERVAAEASRALAMRRGEWQPADPARLELGLQQAREGKAVPPEEARAWFRRGPV